MAMSTRSCGPYSLTSCDLRDAPDALARKNRSAAGIGDHDAGR